MVFSFVANEDETKEWNPVIESVINPDGIDPNHPVGTTFIQGLREKVEIQHVIGKVTAYEKPYLLGLCTRHYDYTVNASYHLTQLDSSTKLRYVSDLTSTNWLHRLFLPIMQAYNKRSVIQQLHLLRVAAEKNYKKNKKT